EKLVGENRSFCGQYWHGRGTPGQISSLLRTSEAKRTFVPKDQKGGWPARDNRRKLGGNSSGCTSFRVADSGLAPQRGPGGGPGNRPMGRSTSRERSKAASLARGLRTRFTPGFSPFWRGISNHWVGKKEFSVSLLSPQTFPL